MSTNNTNGNGGIPARFLWWLIASARETITWGRFLNQGSSLVGTPVPILMGSR
jgi:hypothetical protein